MFKSLIKLLLLVVVPITWLFFFESLNPIVYAAKKALTNYHVSVHRGTFELIEEELKGKPEKQWRDTIETLAPEFGYEVSLVDHNALEDQWQLNRTLNADETIFRDDDDIETLIKRVENTDNYIVLLIDDSNEAQNARQSKGTVVLLNRYLQRHSQQELNVTLAELSQFFEFPAQFTEKESVTLTPLNEKQLAEHGYFWSGENQVIFFIPHQPTGGYITIGPTPNNGNVLIIYFSTLVVCVLITLALALSLWLYPLWRDLKHLDKTSKNFGQGQLDARSTIKNSSIASRLSHSFNLMADDIQNLIQSNRELTNCVAHDLRTPLARLRFAVEMLNDENNQENKQRYQHIVNKSIDNLDYLINQLLTHSRYSRSSDAKNFKLTHLCEIIDEEVELFQDSNTKHKLSTTVDPYFKTNKVWIDPRALTRALQNLLSNANKYAESSISITACLSNDMIELSIEDDGPGIPEESWESLLKPFTQINNNERDVRQGHGLGLAIVNQISIWHMGETRINRSSLGGASITIRWPLKNHSS